MADSSFSSDDGSVVPTMMCIDTSSDELLLHTPASQCSSSVASGWMTKKSVDTSMTPATVSSTSSTSSSLCSSPYTSNNNNNSMVKMISVSSIQMETDQHTTTVTTRQSSPSNSRHQQQQEQQLFDRLQPQALWVPLPSPSRPRLDPRYATRLAPMAVTSHHPHPPLHSPNVMARSRRSSTGSSSSLSSDVDLMPPPSVTRNAGIFRPYPIITPSYCDEQPYNSAKHSDLSSPWSSSPSGQWFASSARNSISSDVTMISSLSTSASITPSPLRPSKRTKADIGVSDRYIPNRATSNFNFNLWEGTSRGSTSSLSSSNLGNSRDGEERNNYSSSNTNDASPSTDSGNVGASSSLHTVTGPSRGLLSTLLRSELLGENENPMLMSSSGAGTADPHHVNDSIGAPLQEGGNLFRYRSPRQAYHDNLYEDSVGMSAIVNSFSLTPVGSAASQRLMATPPKRKRRISKVPFKVLDAPALQDDFYLNLVDWSSQNVLAVGLGSCVYLWSACTSKVTKLCDLSPGENLVTSVSWAQRGTHLAVGTNTGEVQLWDTVKCKKVRTMSGHTGRVGTLAWTGPILASGSRDRMIYLRDVRVQTPFTDKLTNHKQEVCGLKWSYEEPSFLASGGNDNNLHVIDSRHRSEPLHKFTDHTAAVKAIAWSPHQHGLLASGGGTADRCIRFWNTLSGSSLNKIDTGSQVCNLAWSQNCNEIVSTHGYSLNQIVVWRYPSMSKVTTLTGHTFRVLYLAMSPDGSTIVTGAGDETLRFWQIFPGPRSDGKDNSGGILFPNTLGSVIR